MLPYGFVHRGKQCSPDTAIGEIKQKVQKSSHDCGKKKTADLPSGNGLFHNIAPSTGYIDKYIPIYVDNTYINTLQHTDCCAIISVGDRNEIYG